MAMLSVRVATQEAVSEYIRFCRYHHVTHYGRYRWADPQILSHHSFPKGWRGGVILSVQYIYSY